MGFRITGPKQEKINPNIAKEADLSTLQWAADVLQRAAVEDLKTFPDHQREGCALAYGMQS
jgi:hypothetical protein